jgi:hypothetical protein
MKRITDGEPTSFDTLFELAVLRTAVSSSQARHLPHPQTNDQPGGFTKAGRGSRLLTDQPPASSVVGGGPPQDALKVSDSEH